MREEKTIKDKSEEETVSSPLLMIIPLFPPVTKFLFIILIPHPTDNGRNNGNYRVINMETLVYIVR